MRRALVLLLLLTLIGPLQTRAQMHDFEKGQTVVVSFPSKPLRLEPTSNSIVVITVVEGDQLTIIDGDPVQADGLTWWNVETLNGAFSGWLPDTVFTALSENADGGAQCWTANQETDIDGALAWSDPPAMVIALESDYLATITTTAGTIILQLDAANAPIATNNFICLANAGYYDGTEFHRVSSDFLIQGGDATGTGTGTPGYVVESDPTTGNYPAGAVALANAQPNENGAQFFIAVTDLTGEIPDDYPVFGEVISGQEVVAEISHAPVEINPRGELSQPVDPITIQSIEITTQEDEVGPPLPTAETPPTTTPRPSPTAEAAPTVSMPPTDSSAIELDAKDIAFVPTEITIDASDEPVTIEMKNTGAALHNFSIDAIGIDVDVNPGETVDVVIPAGTAPGTYDFYCNVPGHKEAGMVGTLIVESSASAGTEESLQNCQGFATYTSQYDQAFFDAFDVHPTAVRIFETSDDSDSWLLTLTPFELSVIAGLIKDIAGNLQSVRPPEYALEWHRLQIESIQLLAEFLDSAGTNGVMMAAITYDTQRTQLELEVRSTLDDPNSCGEFVTWATDASVILDDDLGAVSSAFAPEVMSIDVMR